MVATAPRPTQGRPFGAGALSRAVTRRAEAGVSKPFEQNLLFSGIHGAGFQSPRSDLQEWGAGPAAGHGGRSAHTAQARRGARGTRLRAAGPLRIFRATRRPHGRRIVFCVAWFVHLLLSSEPGLFSGPDGPPGQDPEPTGPHRWRGRRARLGVWESPEQPDVGRCCPPENVSATSSAPGRS